MNVLKAATLAVENVWKEGLTDIFTPPVELDLLKAKPFREQIIKDTTRCIYGGGLESLAVSPIDHVLMPKGGPFDFRRCALIQPDDTIKYLALVLTIADEVERNRPAIATHRVFSYRLDPSKGYLFRKNHNITSFRKHVADCAKS